MQAMRAMKCMMHGSSHASTMGVPIECGGSTHVMSMGAPTHCGGSTHRMWWEDPCNVHGGTHSLPWEHPWNMHGCSPQMPLGAPIHQLKSGGSSQCLGPSSGSSHPPQMPAWEHPP